MRKILLCLLFLTAVCRPGLAADKIRVVATNSQFADLVNNIAGDSAEIYFVVSPKRDPHFIAPTPRDVLKIKKADVLVHAGLDLELWRGPLLDAAGRGDFVRGEHAVDLSRGIELLEVPTDISRAGGDIHVFGNPHYWLDPDNVPIMARNLADEFSTLYPDRQDVFQANMKKFLEMWDAKSVDWKKRMAPYRGAAIVTYHNSWPYFALRYGLEVAGLLEPKPGIPPTAKHLAEIENSIREKKVPVIISETFRDDRAPKKVASATGASAVTLVQAVGELSEVKDFAGIFEYDVSALEKAFQNKGETT